MSGSDIKVFLLDIEGTTTPFEFVHEVLFPFARHHLDDFLKQHSSDESVAADISILRDEYLADAEHGLQPPPWEGDKVHFAKSYVHWLMNADRKSTGLKSLQGKIWEAGYLSGELRAPVYDDVPQAFKRWQREQKKISIFSSGSVYAQKLLFRNTTAGDLTAYIDEYFDTTTGAKMEEASYRHIASQLNFLPTNILFVSDVHSELDAAFQAGMQTRLCVRPGRPKIDSTHLIVHTFDELG